MFSNPFRKNDAPEHMAAEMNARGRHLRRTIYLCLIGGFLGLHLTPLVVFLYYSDHEVSKNSLSIIMDYLQLSFSKSWVVPHETMMNDRNFIPINLTLSGMSNDTQLKAIFAYMIVSLTTMLVLSLRNFTNTNVKFIRKAEASWANVNHIRAMEARGQVGIIGGRYLNLGIWPDGLRKGRMVRLIETVSVLLLAPPGTGKTAGFVYPALLGSQGVSFVVNDPKPEIYEAVGHAMSLKSDVFMIDWSKVDDPEKKIFYPRFNFLSPKLVPGPGPNRDTYIDTVAKTLIPDKKGGDSYFTNKGRAALTGFLHLLVAKVTDAKNYSGIPKQWIGFEPSMPMMVDWLAVALFKAASPDKKQSEFDDASDEDQDNEGDPDAIRTWIKGLVESVNPENKQPGTSARAFNELAGLIDMADKERSGVLGTMDECLIPFKNEAVKQRTSACDFTPDDLRGVWDDKNKKWKPVTIFICINQAEAEAFATITCLLYEVIAKSLLTYGPGEINEKTGIKMGPFPVTMLLDEFAKLPKMDNVIAIPDLGRSKQLNVLFCAQSQAQIKMIYDEARMDILYGTTSVTIVLAQNDNATTDQIVKMVGKTTIRRASNSYNDGWTKDHLKISRSEQVEEVDFLRSADITGMTPFTHIILVQNFRNRPLKLKTPAYFLDPEMLSQTRARGKGPIATKVIPDYQQKKREAQYYTAKTKVLVNTAKTTFEVQKLAMELPESKR